MALGIKRLLHDLLKVTPEDTLLKALRQLRSLEEFSVVVDVGANTGQSANQFLSLFPRATIYCVEPDPRAFADLNRLAEQEHRIRPFNLALAERSGTRRLNINASNVTNSFLRTSSSAVSFISSEMLRNIGTEDVRTLTLPDFCSMAGIKKIDFLKLDTQGFEDRILSACGQWLQPSRVAIIKAEVNFMRIYDNQAEADCVIRIVRERGFKVHSFHDMASGPSIGLMWGDVLFIEREF